MTPRVAAGAAAERQGTGSTYVLVIRDGCMLAHVMPSSLFHLEPCAPLHPLIIAIVIHIFTESAHSRLRAESRRGLAKGHHLVRKQRPPACIYYDPSFQRAYLLIDTPIISNNSGINCPMPLQAHCNLYYEDKQDLVTGIQGYLRPELHIYICWWTDDDPCFSTQVAEQVVLW
jgi:hypothetical protein